MITYEVNDPYFSISHITIELFKQLRLLSYDPYKESTHTSEPK